MTKYIKINENQEVELKFDYDNNQRIFEMFKRWNDRNHEYDHEDMEKLSDALDMLNDYPTTITLYADVDEVEVDDDVIEEAYEDMHECDGTYDEGYDAKEEEIEKDRKRLKMFYFGLFNKIERISNGFEKVESLTLDEIRQLQNIFEKE